MTKGGARPGAGRKSIGVGKSIKLTLPPEVWDFIETEAKESSKAAVIGNILLQHYGRERNKKEAGSINE